MSQPSSTAAFNHWPHRVAVLLCCATFPLIWVGGLVTTYDAGMAVHDWPSTFGYNLWLYPWSTWFSGPWDLFIEHGHRLLGTLVGMLAIAFVLVVYRSDRHVRLRPLAWVCLAGVLVQGGLGGARVLLDDRQLAMVHGCVGPCFFAYCAALAVMTSRRWDEATHAKLSVKKSASKIAAAGTVAAGNGHFRLAVLTSGLVLLQLLLGAQLRHISVMAGPGQFRAFVFFHLLVAVVLLIHASLLAIKTFRGPTMTNVALPAACLVVLVALQFILGPATWVVNYGWPQWLSELPLTAGHTVQAKSLLQAMIVTAHVAAGSLILASSVVVAVHSYRYARFEATAVGSTAMLVGLAT